VPAQAQVLGAGSPCTTAFAAQARADQAARHMATTSAGIRRRSTSPPRSAVSRPGSLAAQRRPPTRTAQTRLR
jgi:hypothetical protein